MKYELQFCWDSYLSSTTRWRSKLIFYSSDLSCTSIFWNLRQRKRCCWKKKKKVLRKGRADKSAAVAASVAPGPPSNIPHLHLSSPKTPYCPSTFLHNLNFLGWMLRKGHIVIAAFARFNPGWQIVTKDKQPTFAALKFKSLFTFCCFSLVCPDQTIWEGGVSSSTEVDLRKRSCITRGRWGRTGGKPGPVFEAGTGERPASSAELLSAGSSGNDTRLWRTTGLLLLLLLLLRLLLLLLLLATGWLLPSSSLTG